MHALVCKNTRSRHARHSAVNEILLNAFKACGIPSIREPPGISRTDGKRPDGATLTPWARGLSLLWDATVVHRLAASYKKLAANVANDAEARKVVKYAPLSSSYHFHPVAVESLGGFGNSAWGLTNALGRRLQVLSCDGPQTAFLRQRVGRAVQRGNAGYILECANAKHRQARRIYPIVGEPVPRKICFK